MQPMSNAVRRTGITRCQLCHRKGSPSNQLTVHHINGDRRDNSPNNKMVAHRILCHTTADMVTQFCQAKGEDVTYDLIRQVWRSLNKGGLRALLGT